MARRFHFKEVQRPTQWWVWLLVVFAAAGAWVTFILQVVIQIDPKGEPFPDTLAWIFFIVFGLALPLLFIIIRLSVEVSPGKLVISFPPFLHKTLGPADISRAYVRTYRPVREYGGWGVRWGGSNGWAYNMSGNEGVQLELANGKKLLIGSQRAEELGQAIELMLSAAGGSGGGAGASS